MKKLILLFLTTAAMAFGSSLLPSTQEYLTTLAMPADSVCLVCEQVRGAQKKQWLLVLSGSMQALRPGEKSVSGIIAMFQHTLHCSTGRDYEFDDEPFAMDARMIGPFIAASPLSGFPPKVLVERAIGNRRYFEPGVYATAEVYKRVLEEGHAIPALSFLFSAKFSPDQIAGDRLKATAAGLSIEDEREIARSGFALNQFGVIAGRLRSFRDLLGSVIDLPSLFQGVYINIDWSRLSNIPVARNAETADYRFDAPLTLQTRTWLSGKISMVRPTGPLRYCAGLVEIEFDKSQKAPDTTMKIWLINVVDAQGLRTDQAIERTAKKYHLQL